MSWELIALGILSAPLLFLLCYRHAKFAWLLFLGAMLVPMTQAGFDARPLAVLAVAAQVPVRPLRERRLVGAALRCWQVYGLLVITFAVMALASTDKHRTATALVAWVVLLAAVPLFLGRLDGRAIVRLTLGLTSWLLALSAAVILVGWPDAFLGERAVGVLTNPNGLGVLCAMAAPLVLHHKTRPVAMGMLMVIGYLILTSESRAGMLGAMVGLAVLFWQRGGPLVKMSVAPILGLSAAWLYYSDAWTSYGSDGLLRTNNSREAEWAAMVEEFQKRPWFGSGFGTNDGLGSSYLKLAAEMGLVGLSIGLFAVLSLIVLARHSHVALPVLAAALTNAVFEGWLLAAGSSYAVILFVVLVASLDPRCLDKGSDVIPESLESKAP